MPGRKRKSGRRKPCGRLEQADKRPDDRLKVARQPHRRGLDEALRMDERAESAPGRALLRGNITRQEFDAGARYAVVVGEYRASIAVPRATAGAGRGYECMPEECLANLNASPRPLEARPCVNFVCQCRGRRDRYNRAYEALADGGRHVLWQVVRVAIENQEPTCLPHLQVGLKILAQHFGYI